MHFPSSMVFSAQIHRDSWSHVVRAIFADVPLGKRLEIVLLCPIKIDAKNVQNTNFEAALRAFALELARGLALARSRARAFLSPP